MTRYRYRHALTLTTLIAIWSVMRTGADAQSADQILQKMRATYAGMNSYADTGVIVQEYGNTDKHTFSTYFVRSPRHFLLDFRKRGGDRFVIWAEPNAFHTWWKVTGQQTDYANPNNAPALSQSGLNTKNSALKVPALLYPKVDLGGDFNNYLDVSMDGTEDVGGHKCYRLVGRASDTYSATKKEVNLRKMTVWIDAESSLLRQVREDWKTTPGSINRTTTTYQPEANAKIDEAKFTFAPPTE